MQEALDYYDRVDGIAQPELRLHARRVLALCDVFYLLVRECGREDMIHPWLYERCREVQKSPNGHLDLWAREHYKSTIITFGMTIQDLLADPETTVCIFSHTADQARVFTNNIKEEFENNTNLMELFPDVLWEKPKSQAPVWSADELTLKRKKNKREASLTAAGLIDAMPTGMHFMLRVYDDIVTEKTVTNPEMVKKATDRWANSDNLGTEDGAERYIGTRYAHGDTYAVMIERGAAAVRIYAATSDGSYDCEKTVLRSVDYLKRKLKKQGPYIFGCQQLQNPTADKSQNFLEEWLQYWPVMYTSGLNKIIIVDPANEKKKTNDYTAMVVVGKGKDGNYYVCDMVRDRLNPTERIDALFRLVADWKPLFVAYEQYGQVSDIHHIKEKQNRENFRFRIIPVGGQVAKRDRIRGLIPTFQALKLFLPERCIRRNYEGESVDLVKAFVNEEYLPFPLVSHEDLFDALARIHDEDVEKQWAAPKEPTERKFDPIAEAKRRIRVQQRVNPAIIG